VIVAATASIVESSNRRQLRLFCVLMTRRKMEYFLSALDLQLCNPHFSFLSAFQRQGGLGSAYQESSFDHDI